MSKIVSALLTSPEVETQWHSLPCSTICPLLHQESTRHPGHYMSTNSLSGKSENSQGVEPYDLDQLHLHKSLKQSPWAHLHVLVMLQLVFFDINQPSLPTAFYSALCVAFCLYSPLYSPFSCVSFHKFPRHSSAFLLCSFGLFVCLVSPFNCICFWNLPNYFIKR